MADKPSGTPDKVSPSTEEDNLVTKPDIEQVIPEDVLEKLPLKDRNTIRRIFASTTMYSGSFPNPVLSKVTSEHISEVIKVSDKDSDREHEDRQRTRRYTFWIFLTSIIALLGIIVFAVIMGSKDIIVPIISGLGGLGAGYGLGKRSKRSEQQGNLQAYLDTGFDGYLIIPSSLASNLGPGDYVTRWEMGDGSLAEAGEYIGIMEVSDLVMTARLTLLGNDFILGRGIIDRLRITFDRGRRIEVES